MQTLSQELLQQNESAAQMRVTQGSQPLARRLPAEQMACAQVVGGGVLPPAQLVPKQIDRTGCSSIPFGATPVWPCKKSNIGIPVTVTGIFAVTNEVVGVNFVTT